MYTFSYAMLTGYLRHLFVCLLHLVYIFLCNACILYPTLICMIDPFGIHFLVSFFYPPLAWMIDPFGLQLTWRSSLTKWSILTIDIPWSLPAVPLFVCGNIALNDVHFVQKIIDGFGVPMGECVRSQGVHLLDLMREWRSMSTVNPWSLEISL